MTSVLSDPDPVPDTAVSGKCVKFHFPECWSQFSLLLEDH